jgi:DNA polymerase elongation subunit (family B)
VDSEANLVALSDDSQALQAMLRTLINERDQEKRRADKHEQLAEEQACQ